MSDREESENCARDKSAHEQKWSDSALPIPEGQQQLKTFKTEIKKGNWETPNIHVPLFAGTLLKLIF